MSKKDEKQQKLTDAQLDALAMEKKAEERARVQEAIDAVHSPENAGFLKADSIVRKILFIFCNASAVALTVIMLVAFVNVIGEKLAVAGVSWAQGIPNSFSLIQYFHIPVVFLAAGFVTLDMGHTRIDLLIQKLPGVEKIALLIGHVLGAALGFYICYTGLTVTLVNDFERHTKITSAVGAPYEWPFTICHCLGFFLLGCSFVWAFIRMIKFWKIPGANPGMYITPQAAPGEEPVDVKNKEEVTKA